MGKSIFDPYYVAEVLSDLLSRQRGCEIKIELTPKESSVEASTNGAGG